MLASIGSDAARDQLARPTREAPRAVATTAADALRELNLQRGAS